GKCEFFGNYSQMKNFEIVRKISSHQEICEDIIELETALINHDEIINSNQVDVYRDIEHIDDINTEPEENQIPRDNERSGTAGLSVYKVYLNAGASFFFKIITLLMLIISQSITSASDLWLIKWLQDTRSYNQSAHKIENIASKTKLLNSTMSDTFHQHQEIHIYVYLGLICAVFFTMLVSAILLNNLFTTASIKLHKKFFKCIIRTPISFLDNNPVGKVLNRFSKDISNMDDTLPFIFHHLIKYYSLFVGVFVVEAIILPYLLILTSVLSIIFYFLWTIHSRVLESIKYWEGK
ncbi:multidrug resistance-associated protein 4-like, partial [Centruroides sculpturatus]|uniref:multidrug resistance-associated protein 4-like n=1 Tax=Centruroides sculpturatus TaxID=218467 RepID=UPI000C6EE8A8